MKDGPIKLMIVRRSEDGMFQCGYRMPGEEMQLFERIFHTFEEAQAKLKEFGEELAKRFGTEMKRSPDFNN